MDQITHNVRRSNWLSIIEQCQSRPEGMTAKQWMSDNGISPKSLQMSSKILPVKEI